MCEPLVSVVCHSVWSVHFVCSARCSQSHSPGDTCQGGQRPQEIRPPLSSLPYISECVCASVVKEGSDIPLGAVL